MNRETEHVRRASAARPINGANIPRPPPPPLIAPRPLQRARNIVMATAGRYLGYSRPPSPESEREEGRFTRSTALLHRRTPLSMSQNASASHKTGLSISTIAINEQGTHALIAGKDIFKTVKVEDGRCAEDFNLRTSILGAPRTASGAPRNVYQIDIADVAWAKGDHGDFVAAATSSGKIIIYNLGVAGLKAVQLHEHFRQVHKITFNPHRGNFLLSGSQDGTVRLWDIRAARDAASTLPSKRKYSGQADAVRDVKWSPTEGLDFAFGTDNGDIQRWDMRNLKMPKVKISGHLLACNAIDWHPDGKHIISASSDKTVRVFDVSTVRSKKASWEIRTPYPVMNARWRPSCESTMPSHHGARLCVQVMTSYDPSHPIMHLYDLRRPALPFKEIVPYASAPTDFLWHSQDLLWTVGREGNFVQTDVKTVPKVVERTHLQTISFSPLNEVLVVAQRCVSRHSTAHAKPALRQNSNSSFSTGADGVFSRSWADDGIDPLFLEVLPLRSRYENLDGNVRSHVSASSPVPGTACHASAPTLKLDDVLQHRKSARPHQEALQGGLPSQADVRSSVALSVQPIGASELSQEVSERISFVEGMIERCVKSAASLGQHQLSQTWKIVQFCVVNHLQERRQLRQKLKAANQLPEPRSLPGLPPLPLLASRLAFHYVKSPTQSPGSMRPASSAVQHLALPPESTSNLPTPLARPTPSSKLAQQLSLPDPADEALALPPSLARSHSPQVAPLNEKGKDSRPQLDQRLTTNNLCDLQKQQSHKEEADRIDMVRRWSVQPRVPLNLDRVNLDGMDRPPPLEKHDSNESFKFLEGSFDSRSAGFSHSYSSLEFASRMVAERPSRTKDHSTVSKSQSEDQTVPSASDSLPFEGSGILANSPDRHRSSTEESSHAEPVDRPLPYENGQQFTIQMTSSPQGSETSLPFEPASRDFVAPLSRVEAASRDETESDIQDTTARAVSQTARTMDKLASAFDGPPQTVHNRDVEYIDIEDDKPWTLVEMLQKLIEFYTVERPHPQTVSTLLLLVGPLLPLTHPLPDDDIRQMIQIYSEYFIDHLALDAHEADRWFAACDYEQSLLAGISPLQIEGALCAYHDQLLAQRLFTQAAELRRVAYPAYPSLYEDFIKDNAIHFKCGNCQKSILPSAAGTRCLSCQTSQYACPICCMPHSPWATPTGSASSSPSAQEVKPGIGEARTWTACLACGHSGHPACYQHWFVEAAGIGCPFEGCLCSCVSAGEIGAVI